LFCPCHTATQELFMPSSIPIAGISNFLAAIFSFNCRRTTLLFSSALFSQLEFQNPFFSFLYVSTRHANMGQYKSSPIGTWIWYGKNCTQFNIVFNLVH
jgi:hypothetical protein